MGKRGKKRKQRQKAKARTQDKTLGGRLTYDAKRKTGHYQGTYYSDVYANGKCYVYTAWNDNEDVEGSPISFEKWLATYTG